MKTTGKLFKVLALLAVCAGMAGCVTVSTIESRKRECYPAYAALPPDFKAAVDTGTVRAGMNFDAVYMAWGKPGEILTGGNQSGETTTWIYRGAYLYEQSYWGYYRMHYAYTTVPYTRAKVVFANGVVREWQRYEHP